MSPAIPIVRTFLDGIAMSAIFHGLAAVLVLINPRDLFDVYPKSIQKAASQPMSKAEHCVKRIFAFSVLGLCWIYEIVSNFSLGIVNFRLLFTMGYMRWNGMKQLALPEHFILWPLLEVPVWMWVVEAVR